MKILDYGEKYENPVVLVLGFFDCVHVGHAALVKEAIARSDEGEPCVFTFANDMGSFFGKGEGSVLTFSERTERLGELGVGLAVKAVFDRAFSETEPEEFLDKLFSSLNVKRVVCGFDYTFGRYGKGNVGMLADSCGERNIGFSAVGCVEMSGEKVSTTKVKELLAAGDVPAANKLLGYPYFLRGEVVKDRGVGRTIGFPTANVKIGKDKFRIAAGVYESVCTVDGVTYPAITNYGSRPTFGLGEVLTETYLIGFSGNLYGKSLRVNFLKYLRGDKKFAGIEELKEQLRKDEETSKNDFIRTER